MGFSPRRSVFIIPINTMRRNIIVSALLLLFITFAFSCEKKESPVKVTDEMARDTLYDIMEYWYYWHDNMPAINKKNYSNPYTLLEALRYDKLDRWSFVADYEKFMADMAGEFYGHGFSMGVDEEDNARIAMIYSESPLYIQGVRRGWIVSSINGHDIATVIKNGDAYTYNLIFSAPTSAFVFKKPDGTLWETTSTKSKFTINTVLEYDTLKLKSGTAGHLVLESFKSSTSAELEEAFDFFRDNNVSDLIIDFRYNSGGYLDVALEMSNYIAGNNLNSEIFSLLRYSDKRSRHNYSYYFGETSVPLDISNIVFITSRATASASEALINGLKPFFNIVSVGDTTYGKPMGMDGWACAEKYIFYPVTFKVVNAQGQGEYFGGLPPEIIGGDDLKHDFNDREEECLKYAIEYLENGTVTAKSEESRYRPVYMFNRPKWSDNMFTTIP